MLNDTNLLVLHPCLQFAVGKLWNSAHPTQKITISIDSPGSLRSKVHVHTLLLVSKYR